MKRLILGIAAAMITLLVSPLIAQTHETTFRTIGSGLWTSSENWMYEAGGVWLVPVGNNSPGNPRNRGVDVVIDNGASVRIADGEYVEVNSLFVKDGDLIVEGTLFVGESKNGTADVSPSGPERFVSALVLEQNVPNPITSHHGMESTFRFYLDKEYAGVSLVLYDMMGKEIQSLYVASNPTVGWHSVRVNVRDLPSGNYPVLMQVPGMPAERRLMTVVR